VGWFLLAGVACGLPELADDAPSDSTPAPVDADHDSWASDVDCDDHDASVNPGANEVCLDGVDQSCVEGADHCVWSGTATIEGTEIGSDTRGAVVGAPIAVCDVDSDGQLDLVMGAPEMYNTRGALYVFRGPLKQPRSIDEADYALRGTGAWMAAASSLDCRGDVDGDGDTDLVVGERGSVDADAWGAAYVVSGIGTGMGQLDHAATITWRGEYAGELVGYEVAALDEDGNGQDDVAVTVWGIPGDATEWGRTWVVSEPDVRNHALERVAGAYVYGTGSEDSILGAHGAGDLDADGFEELVVVGHTAELDAVDVFLGPLSGAMQTADADARITDSEQGLDHSVGHADLDADGKDDLFAGNPDNESSTVTVFLGGIPVEASTAEADVRIHCNRAGAIAGKAVVSPGDVTADGVGDLLVGASGEDAVYLIGGGVPGTYDLDHDAQAVLNGDHVGFSLATGDVTGDGITDFVISDSSLTMGWSGVVVMASLDL